LRALVEADLKVADRLHADDFQLIEPSGGVLSKEQYLGMVASGEIDYLVWEPDSSMEVRMYGPFGDRHSSITKRLVDFRHAPMRGIA
jgi:hypothetical protein